MDRERMSSTDRAERITHLRRAVEQIERPRDARQADRLKLTRELDRALSGGLSSDALCEIAPAEPADAPSAFAFALSLAAGFMAARRASALLVVEDFALSQGGAPFGPGLVAYGLDLSRIVFVRAPDAGALFQTLEDALKSGALAVVVGEVWRLAKYDLSVSRRLSLAARAGATPALLTLPTAHGQTLSTAAETRFEIAAAPSPREPSAGAGKPLPGAPAFAARLVKVRGGADSARSIRLIWRSEEQMFDEPAISVPVAAAAADRSGAARA
jgi:protein ImuA